MSEKRRTFVDQMNRVVSLSTVPKSIISLVPSQTELLFSLGLDSEVKGITKFCIHPKERVKLKTKIGGTKRFHFDLIDRLDPDLIIANKEENYKYGIERLAQKYPVWVSDVGSLPRALEMIDLVGELTGKEERAQEISKNIKNNFQNLDVKRPLTVLYFIWKRPYMIAGRNTFIDDMLSRIGLKNAANKRRYPEISMEEVKDISPDLVMLSSEPYPFKSQHVTEFERFLPDSKVIIVDGEMFSWYGSRLLYAPEYFSGLRI